MHHEGLTPEDHDSGYKCYLTRLPPAVTSHFCRRFAEAVDTVRSSTRKDPEVTACVRFPVANVLQAVRRGGQMKIDAQNGQSHKIRNRTWKVSPALHNKSSASTPAMRETLQICHKVAGVSTIR